MLPVLARLGPVEIPAYGTFVLLAFAAAWGVRRRETRRLEHHRMPGYHWVGVGALVGAAVGAKLGMVLFTPLGALGDLARAILALDFTGKTVIGGLVGGFVGVEVAKKAVGITSRTGDGFAVAVPVAQAVARIGCLLHGCCYGTVWDGPWALRVAGALRHPAPLYEAAGTLLLAGILWRLRGRLAKPGDLFRLYLAGYGLLRFAVEFVRGDPAVFWGPLKAAQWVCLAAVLGFGIPVLARLLRR